MSALRILMAEDNPDHQQLLQLALTESSPGSVVQVAATGGEAVERLRASAPGTFDCVVMDYNLPDRPAEEVLRQLSDQSDRPPVIVISSGKSQDIVIDSLRSGGVDFVPKEEALTGDFLWERVQLAVTQARRALDERRKVARRTERLTRISEMDPLTGLSNRRAIDRLLINNRHTVDRRGRVSMVMIDLDHFKQINDEYGHESGDRVLFQVAETLRDSTTDRDVICRWGGEEFIVLRLNSSLAATVLWAESLRRQIERSVGGRSGLPAAVTACIGVVNCLSSGLSMRTVAYADEAMYLAKHRGRNQVCTGEMVAFDRLLTRVCGSSLNDPEARLHELLRLAAPLLGPAQREHLTAHPERVQKTAMRLAGALDCSAAETDRLRFASLAHDLGNTIIPEETLAKSGPLFGEEMEFLSYHARYGAEMAERLGADTRTREFILHHHTRFIGALPGGANAVPLGARILAAADAFVAMTSPQAYKSCRSISAAVSEIQRCRGTQFEPRVVEVLPGAIRNLIL